MAENKYDNEKRFVLFANERKNKDTDPTHQGSVTLGGVEYYLDAWTNTSSSGKRYLSGRIGNAKQGADTAPATTRAATPRAAAPRREAELHDEIPF